jgi:hypothetical protein
MGSAALGWGTVVVSAPMAASVGMSNTVSQGRRAIRMPSNFSTLDAFGQGTMETWQGYSKACLALVRPKIKAAAR